MGSVALRRGWIAPRQPQGDHRTPEALYQIDRRNKEQQVPSCTSYLLSANAPAKVALVPAGTVAQWQEHGAKVSGAQGVIQLAKAAVSRWRDLSEAEVLEAFKERERQRDSTKETR